MTLAAIEAYCLGDGGRRGKQLETLGYIWGYRKEATNQTVYLIDKLSISLSARRHSDYVIPHPEAARLKNDVVSRWSPHLSLLGDFHTHPFKDSQEVKEARGFEFSESDFEHFKGSNIVWEEAGGAPVMLAMTVCRMKRVREAYFGEQLRGNLCGFRVGEFRFWLNAAVGHLDQGERCCTRNTYSNVFLDLNSRFFNMRGDRINTVVGK